MTIRARQRGLTRELDYSDFLEKRNPTVDISWGAGVSDLVEALGLDFVEDALGGVSAIVQQLRLLLDLLQGVAEVLVSVIGRAVTDIAEALVVILEEAVKRIINLFTGVSVNVLTHFPDTQKSKRKPSEVLYDVGTSYLDTQDDKRPNMVDDVYGVGILALWSLPNIDSLSRQKDKVMKNLSGIGSDFGKISEIDARYGAIFKDWRNPLTSEGSSGMAPDFRFSADLTLIPAIRSLVDKLTKLSQVLKRKKSDIDKIQEILNLVERRLDAINKTVNDIITSVASVAALLSFGDANAVLLIKGSGQSIDFAQAIINAPLHPNYPKSKLIENINNLSSSRGLENPIDRDLGEENLYSGAALLHLQVPNVPENVATLNALASAMFKEVEDVTTTNAKAQATRLESLNERRKRLERSSNESPN